MTRLGLALPTEAQWENAARATTHTVWCTGDDMQSVALAANTRDRFCREHIGEPTWNYDDWLDDGYAAHAPVGSYRANRYGLHDVIGNVWEWCMDEWNEGFYTNSPWHNPIAGGVILPVDNFKDVTTPRDIRGRSWDDLPKDLRVAFRGGIEPKASGSDLGFRCARNVMP